MDKKVTGPLIDHTKETLERIDRENEIEQRRAGLLKPPLPPGGLSFGEILIACRNVGVNLECGGCASAFFTGYGGDPHDENCTRRQAKLADYDSTESDAIDQLASMLRQTKKDFPAQQTHSASIKTVAGAVEVTYSVSVSRGEV